MDRHKPPHSPDQNPDFKLCLLIPFYNHQRFIANTLTKLQPMQLPCILVDDGSSTACKQVLHDVLGQHPWVELVTLSENSGKGAAFQAGLETAAKRGFSHVLQIDADGQHNHNDIPKLITSARQHPHCLISGQPIYDDSVPKARFYGRYATHIMVWIETLSLQIQDSMCGFRIYPVAETSQIYRRHRIGRRMDFDTDIAVKLHWAGVPMIQIPTQVIYQQDGVSHFKLWHDNVLISLMHTRLFFGMLWRLPRLLARKFRVNKA